MKRINPELALPYTPRELPPEFGTKIFSGGAAVEDKPKGPQYEREVEFKLNAINIDEKRAIADINGKRLRVGDVVQGAEVIAIIKGQVVLQINNKKFVLSTNSRIKKIKLMGGRSEK